jgi:hypothetical protein
MGITKDIPFDIQLKIENLEDFYCSGKFQQEFAQL